MKKFLLAAAVVLSVPAFASAADLQTFLRPLPLPGAFQCVATNARGQRFLARGLFLVGAQRAALNECQRRSAVCRIVRCNRVL